MAASRRSTVRYARRRSDIWTDLTRHRASLATLYAFAPMERIRLVKEGVPADVVTFLVVEMATTKERLYRMAGVARATIDRKVRAGVRLNQDESERILGIARLVGQAEQIVAESGETKGFDAAKWIASWLERPIPALGRRTPASLMDTAEGRELVSELLGRMQSGAYA